MYDKYLPQSPTRHQAQGRVKVRAKAISKHEARLIAHMEMMRFFMLGAAGLALLAGVMSFGL